MNIRFLDWIWHIRGSVALAPGQSHDDAFERLDPLFRQTGTTRQRADGTLTFRKTDQAAQDKMSVFDSGALHIEDSVAGPVLRYHLVSRALLFCFLAPLLFVAIAQGTILLGTFQKPESEAASKAADAKHKAVAKKAAVPMNPIDAFLGAPAPEKPEKDAKAKAGGGDKKMSPTTAYVFAGIFAALYVVGRILEDWLIRSVFRKRLQQP